MALPQALTRTATEDDFTAFVESQHARLVRLAARIVGELDAEDVVQTVWLEMWSRWCHIHEHGRVAYTMRVVTTRAVDAIRRRGRFVLVEPETLNEMPIASAYGDPVSHMERQESAARVREILAQLVPRQRCAIQCAMAGRVKGQGAQISAEKHLLHRARRHLRSLLADEHRHCAGPRRMTMFPLYLAPKERELTVLVRTGASDRHELAARMGVSIARVTKLLQRLHQKQCITTTYHTVPGRAGRQARYSLLFEP